MDEKVFSMIVTSLCKRKVGIYAYGFPFICAKIKNPSLVGDAFISRHM